MILTGHVGKKKRKKKAADRMQFVFAKTLEVSDQLCKNPQQQEELCHSLPSLSISETD